MIRIVLSTIFLMRMETDSLTWVYWRSIRTDIPRSSICSGMIWLRRHIACGILYILLMIPSLGRERYWSMTGFTAGRGRGSRIQCISVLSALEYDGTDLSRHAAGVC